MEDVDRVEYISSSSRRRGEKTMEKQLKGGRGADGKRKR